MDSTEGSNSDILRLFLFCIVPFGGSYSEPKGNSSKRVYFYFVWRPSVPEEPMNGVLMGQIGTVLPQTNEKTASSLQHLALTMYQPGIWGHGTIEAPQGMYTTTSFSVIVTGVSGLVSMRVEKLSLIVSVCDFKLPDPTSARKPAGSRGDFARLCAARPVSERWKAFPVADGQQSNLYLRESQEFRCSMLKVWVPSLLKKAAQ